MSKVADRFETQAVRGLYRTILYEEEHKPLPANPSPEQLMERVDSRLEMVEHLIGNYERGGSNAADLTVVAVHLMWLGATALTASIHIDPQCADLEPTGLKDDLLSVIDRYVATTVRADWDDYSQTPRELFEHCSWFVSEANEYVAAEDRTAEILESAAVSLCNVASSATVALAHVELQRTQSR
jgi:hypothetical protein